MMKNADYMPLQHHRIRRSVKQFESVTEIVDEWFISPCKGTSLRPDSHPADRAMWRQQFSTDLAPCPLRKLIERNPR